MSSYFQSEQNNFCAAYHNNFFSSRVRQKTASSVFCQSNVADTLYWMQSLDKTDKIIINLKVLSTLQEGQRLCIRGNQFSIWDAGWTQAALRWAYGEDRWVNLEDIQLLITDALRILGTYMNLVQHAYTVPSTQAIPVPTPGASLGFVNSLSRDLRNAIHGLENLKKTYAGDQRMIATLELLVDRVMGEIEKATSMVANTPTNPQAAQPSETAEHPPHKKPKDTK